MLYRELGRFEHSDLELEYGHIMTGGWPEDLKIKDDLKISQDDIKRLWDRLEFDYEIRVCEAEKEKVETLGDLKKLIYEYMCVV